MAEDRSVKFCARVGPGSVSLVMTNCPQVGVVKVIWRLIFSQRSVNNSKTVQDRDLLTMEDCNRKLHMAYQMTATAVTLNDLEGHSQVAGLFEYNPSNIGAAFYTISTVLARFLCISRASCSSWFYCDRLN